MEQGACLPVMQAPISKMKRVEGCCERTSANHSLPTWPSLSTMSATGILVVALVLAARIH